MSAFDVYLVMQLDSIIGFFVTMAFISGLASIPIGFAFVMCAGGYTEEDRVLQEVFKKLLLSWVIPVFFISLFAQSVIPSTKTAAAMIVLPAITSQEALDTIKPEMKELYELTKKSLENIANPKEVEK